MDCGKRFPRRLPRPREPRTTWPASNAARSQEATQEELLAALGEKHAGKKQLRIPTN